MLVRLVRAQLPRSSACRSRGRSRVGASLGNCLREWVQGLTVGGGFDPAVSVGDIRATPRNDWDPGLVQGGMVGDGVDCRRY
jgi:hypothetical protein